MFRIANLFIEIVLFVLMGLAFIAFFGFFLALWGAGMYYADGNTFQFAFSLLMFICMLVCAVLIGATGIESFIYSIRNIWTENY